MKEQRITIEIGADGKLTADAEGFSGDTCVKELEKLLEGLAAVQVSVDRKPGATGAGVAVSQESTAQNARKGKP